MGNIFKLILIFLLFFTFVFSQPSSLETLKTPQKQELPDLKWESKTKKIFRQLRRSEIIFFISLPLTFLVNNLLFGSSGSANLLNPEDYTSSYIVAIQELNRTEIYRYRRIEHQRYNRNAFNATEVLIWFNSLMWSFAIAINDSLENSVNGGNLRVRFDGERFLFDFFSERF